MKHEQWKIDPVPPLAIIIDDEDGNGVCEMDGDPNALETRERAKLIGAAPDLMAVALSLVDADNEWTEDTDPTTALEWFGNVAQKARKVIAEAT